MTKDKFKELAYLNLLDELQAEEKIKFENAILENDEFKAVFEEIKGFYASINAARMPEVDESVLVEARYALMRSVRHAEAKMSLSDSIKDFVNSFLYRNYKFVFSVALTVVTGILIGYMMFSPKQSQQYYSASQEVINENNGNSKGNTPVIIPTPAEDNTDTGGTFDAVKPVKTKVRENSPSNGKMLAALLTTEANPGVRLQTVNRIADNYQPKATKPDDEIKKALISALREDSNPAVRKEALNVLVKYPYDKQIRDALVYVLSNDKNSGLRIMAIKSLSDLKFKGQVLDEKIRTVLTKQAETDKNGFIRIHAASMLKEAE